MSKGRVGFLVVFADGILAGQKAMKEFPQPNYVMTKFAEEAGEVIKECVHVAEGRGDIENLRKEMTQVIGVLYRLWVEGDKVHGLEPVGEMYNRFKATRGLSDVGD